MHVPVHRQAVASEQLHAVHADVVRGRGSGVAIVGVDRVDAGKGDEAPSELLVPGRLVHAVASGRLGVGVGRVADGFEVAVERPAADKRDSGQVDLGAGADDFLAGPAGLEAFGPDAGERRELAEFFDAFGKGARRLGLDEGVDAGGDGLETVVDGRPGGGMRGGLGPRAGHPCHRIVRVAAEGDFHAAVGAEGIDKDGEVRAFDAFEEQGRSTAVEEPWVVASGRD